jgi:hypothetical protein
LGKEVKGMHFVGAPEELVTHHHLERGQEGSTHNIHLNIFIFTPEKTKIKTNKNEDGACPT